MYLIGFLICFPLIMALLLYLIKNDHVRKYFVYAACGVIIAASVLFAVRQIIGGANGTYLRNTHLIDLLMSGVELVLFGVIVYYSIRYRKYYVVFIAAVQEFLLLWMEFFGPEIAHPTAHIYSDRLTLIMCLIIGIVGCLICIYATGYMKDYHNHHKDFKNRKPFFFSMLFVFLGAMYGLVCSNNLTWIYFFWEITSLCSFLLIGYNKTEEAIKNSFRALWMNLLGGLAFAIAIVYCRLVYQIDGLQELVLMGAKGVLVIIPVILLAFAGLTKSAQLPFSGWLLGAMVAPTPTSALLHSATMVKAGVYLLLRLSPALAGNLAGTMVTSIGGFTFFATSLLAIAQTDGKKVLAYSTVSNLGLITACAGVGIHEAVWAGILLMIFHAVSKSLMFLSVGAVENCTGSRNIEDMHGLIVKLPKLAFVMIVGIAGMFLAPFGMLISKWAALKAFVDSKSILMVVFLVYGSASTLFYWTKWLGKIIAVVHNSEKKKDITKRSEWTSLLSQAVIMIILCVTFPIISAHLIEPLLSEMFHDTIPVIISKGNVFIMAMMLCMIAILPIVARLLTHTRRQKVVLSYMGGANTGDDRNFVNSFEQETKMYLAGWYMEDYFGEKRLWRPSLIGATAALVILMIIAIGGAV
ncbi:NADH-quinone oxidoreductase subunit L [Acetivibrio sp. MSJd-27]|uniref:NADH-quinone oxidoreductase subunit 5 family protein n=1 Tax=Acetivibrio sp. MSJd-27 TaxID=2841523 RepID=UPI001C0FCC44|nr:proton-conducting transporter membrane subunit [Acetivibrio sp. MSJd-27]MBU5451255.1 NADH-quinone oxidoreductase subunit L [Acetivibrio sp. MSJd-27]